MPARLRVYRFGPEATFEGGLVAALERLQIRRRSDLVDALFLRRDADSGALDALDLATGARDSTFASLLDFRLDPGRRRRLTERTLREHPGGVPPSLLEELAAGLEPGAALLALIHAGESAEPLEDAVARCGGRAVGDEPVAAGSLGEAGPRLLALAGSP
jgi:hypothetical protein